MSEWHQVSLADISNQRKGINYKSDDYCTEDSGHPFITIKCFVKGGGYQPKGIKYFNGLFTQQDTLKPDDILFSITDLTRAGDIVGSPLKVPNFGEGRFSLASMDCMRMIPLADLCNSSFLYHRMMLSDIRRQMVKYSAGSTVLHLDTKQVPKMKIDIPKKKSEQTRIAYILDTADQTIEKTEALIEKYQQIKAGLMHDLFTRGITADGKLRPTREQAPEQYQETPIGWIPKDWEVSSLEYYLDSTAGLKPGPFGSSLKKQTFVEFGYKVYGQEQVISNDQSLGDYYINKQKYFSLQGFSVAENDVLVSLVGTIGKVLVIRNPYEAGIINPRLMRVRPNLTKVSVEFLKYILISNDMKRQLEQFAGGGTMPVLNAKIVRAVKVPIIRNLEEQVEISTLLDKAELKVSTELQELSKLQKLKSGLMHDLLTGKVTVAASHV
jgi:type I restriction enzyme S subunit